LPLYVLDSSDVSDRLVLASASPRRRELLAALGLDFDVIPADLDEDKIALGLPPAEGAAVTASAKASAIAAVRPASLILAADTVVIHQGRSLGKPSGPEAAREMLAALRGRGHEVVTAVCLRQGEREQLDSVLTQVTMREYGPREVESYVASDTPLDKAGAYGIQDEPFRPVARIEGCYCNVVGLPLWTAYSLLAAAGCWAPRAPAAAFERCRACPLAR
jgi:MAF protein